MSAMREAQTALDRIATDAHLLILDNLHTLDDIGGVSYVYGDELNAGVGETVTAQADYGSRKAKLTFDRYADWSLRVRDTLWPTDRAWAYENISRPAARMLVGRIESDLRHAVDAAGDPARVLFATANLPLNRDVCGFVKSFDRVTMRSMLTYDIGRLSEVVTFDVAYGIGVAE
ncbi:hypothetical protein QNA24_29895 [Rhodococcus qingshengii]|uniref:hypothetical protein n=1 Tax=Rhodococcus TaxID=1827 RepID=UPI001E579798|nr:MULTISPECIES: hypothetical protein [Rhodococcus]MCD2099584.1 hypothetical protein [Rhodococcus rhodochrous]MCD2123952.1 hypothetical protein [Rhodococcus rhodochrous]MCQ4136619.1 hypothetical protein [Rhodococcus rhodochrous]MDJ0490596.1 hypothetical protein [Rhodococcus qingshengii]